MDEQLLVDAYNKEVQQYPFRFSYEHIFFALSTCIIHLTVSPNTILSDSGLAALFNASRTSVRQALFMLVDSGLIVYKKNCGFRVKPFSPSEFNSLYEYRRIIEPAVAGFAAERATKQQIVELKALLDKSRQDEYATLVEKGRSYYLYEAQFHAKLADISGNAYLQNAVSAIKTDAQRAWGLCFYVEHFDAKAVKTLRDLSFYKRHYPIFYAISIGAPAMARETMLEHLSFQPIT